MKKRVRRKTVSKERIIMTASAVLVLSTLTATGMWLKGDAAGEENYVVDLSAIENDGAAGVPKENIGQISESITEQTVPSDDLDYDPYFQETNSGRVENPDLSESTSMSEGVTGAQAEDILAEADTAENAALAESEEKTADTPAISTAMQPALNFSDTDTLVWPIVGNILINYSMDKTIYFPTLDQYKYNPAIVIQANEGDMITAAAAGKVTGVFEDAQIGKAVTMDLGGGYEITYGQLDNILVSEGSYVFQGDMIAQVAAPTKYYSVEGNNVYFKLTKDGQPVNPMSKLN